MVVLKMVLVDLALVVPKPPAHQKASRGLMRYDPIDRPLWIVRRSRTAQRSLGGHLLCARLASGDGSGTLEFTGDIPGHVRLHQTFYRSERCDYLPVASWCPARVGRGSLAVLRCIASAQAATGPVGNAVEGNADVPAGCPKAGCRAAARMW